MYFPDKAANGTRKAGIQSMRSFFAKSLAIRCQKSEFSMSDVDLNAKINHRCQHEMSYLILILQRFYKYVPYSRKQKESIPVGCLPCLPSPKCYGIYTYCVMGNPILPIVRKCLFTICS